MARGNGGTGNVERGTGTLKTLQERVAATDPNGCAQIDDDSSRRAVKSLNRKRETEPLLVVVSS